MEPSNSSGPQFPNQTAPVTPVSQPESNKQSTPPQNPIKKSSKLSIKALIGIIIFLLLAGGTTVFIFREQILSLSTPNATKAPDLTNNWEKYENAEYDFTIKYPQNLHLKESESGGEYPHLFGLIDKSRTIQWLGETENPSYSFNIDSHSDTIDSYIANSSNGVRFIKKHKFGNNEFTQVQLLHLGVDEVPYYLYQLDNNILKIADFMENEELTKQILSSFRQAEITLPTPTPIVIEKSPIIDYEIPPTQIANKIIYIEQNGIIYTIDQDGSNNKAWIDLSQYCAEDLLNGCQLSISENNTFLFINMASSNGAIDLRSFKSYSSPRLFSSPNDIAFGAHGKNYQNVNFFTHSLDTDSFDQFYSLDITNPSFTSDNQILYIMKEISPPNVTDDNPMKIYTLNLDENASPILSSNEKFYAVGNYNENIYALKRSSINNRGTVEFALYKGTLNPNGNVERFSEIASLTGPAYANINIYKISKDYLSVSMQIGDNIQQFLVDERDNSVKLADIEISLTGISQTLGDGKKNLESNKVLRYETVASGKNEFNKKLFLYDLETETKSLITDNVQSAVWAN